MSDILKLLPFQAFFIGTDQDQIAQNLLFDIFSMLQCNLYFQPWKEAKFIYQLLGNNKSVQRMVENNVGKGEIAHYEQFLLFPPCFQMTYKINADM